MYISLVFSCWVTINVTHFCNEIAGIEYIRVIKYWERMLTFLDHQLIEVNIEVTAEFYATGYNCKGKSI